MINLIKVKVKKVGGSTSLFVQKDDSKTLKLKENEELFVEVQRGNPLRELFGSGKFSKPTRQLLKEFRGLESKNW
ncbi:MAG: hypothetical protein HYW50_00165 [Candidatus Diapherotrites archaeon]|nr:hypothetical protein [Candidatus Diapherotrites archaeon]